MKREVEVIWSDEDVVIANKPSGLTVIPDRYQTNQETLQTVLEKKFGKLFVVHRVDRGTSGIVCFARTEDAHRNVSIQFQEHTVEKKYHAIVQGRMHEKSGMVNGRIAENPAKPGTMVIHQSGKDALSVYTLLEQFKNAALLEVDIKTGRTHQIRVHMAYINHPLAVDDIYGGNKGLYLSSLKKNYRLTDEEERPIISRLTLHAYSLKFSHPKTGLPVEFKAPYHKDFEVALKMLRKFS